MKTVVALVVAALDALPSGACGLREVAVAITDGGPITQKELARAVGLPQSMDRATRVVRERVRVLRTVYGFPICSGPDGYYMPTSQTEIDGYMRRLESEARARCRSSMVTYHKMRALFALPPQSNFLDRLGAVLNDDDPEKTRLRMENEMLKLHMSRWGRPSDAVRRARWAGAVDSPSLFPT